TPPMALHRGRIDLLEEHLRSDPDLLSRTFTYEEIYPRALGCHKDPTLALNGTPTAGGTLLHLCVDFDEMEIAQWLLSRGADVNAKSTVDADGFGGHTALFGCVVSQPYRVGRQKDGSMARLLLEHGADLTIRASLRKELRFVEDESLHEYRDVTPFEWGQQFHDQDWVCPSAMEMVKA
ncbi:ankyrin repeat domain-containing protein, partial [bacterium]